MSIALIIPKPAETRLNFHADYKQTTSSAGEALQISNEVSPGFRVGPDLLKEGFDNEKILKLLDPKEYMSYGTFRSRK